MLYRIMFDDRTRQATVERLDEPYTTLDPISAQAVIHEMCAEYEIVPRLDPLAAMRAAHPASGARNGSTA